MKRFWIFLCLWGKKYYDERINAPFAWELAGVLAEKDEELSHMFHHAFDVMVEQTSQQANKKDVDMKKKSELNTPKQDRGTAIRYIMGVLIGFLAAGYALMRVISAVLEELGR